MVPSSSLEDRPLDAPNRFDVLLGRGRGNRRHVGNQRYDALIKKYREAYTLAQNCEKKAISAQIVSIILEKGRFLKRNKNEGWTIVQSGAARVKVAQALQYRRRCSLMSQEAADSNKQEDAPGSVHDVEESSSDFSCSGSHPEPPNAWQIPNTVQSGTEAEWQLETKNIPVFPSSIGFRDRYQPEEEEWLQATSMEQKMEVSAWTNDLLTDARKSIREDQQATGCIATCPSFSRLRYEADLQEDGWFQSPSGGQMVESSACTLPFESARDVDLAAPAAHRQCGVFGHSDTTTVRNVGPGLNTDAETFEQIVDDDPTAGLPSASTDASCSSISVDAQLWELP